MKEQHGKETDPITSGNQMTNDEIAGRDQEAAPDTSDKHDKATSKKTDTKQSDDSSGDQPDLSHEEDDASDVEESDASNQEK